VSTATVNRLMQKIPLNPDWWLLITDNVWSAIKRWASPSRLQPIVLRVTRRRT